MKKKFDLTTIYHEKRPLSWSAISSFEWNKRQWYDKYVLGILPEITPELEFGSRIDKKIQADPKFLPHVIRYSTLQHEMRTMYDGIPLLGFSDAWDPVKLKLRDYKTGRKPWDQKRANETGQITMYLGMLYLQHKIKPEDVEAFIDWLPTHIEDGKIAFIEPDHKKLIPRTFSTRRSMKDVLTFFQRIKATWQLMEEYCEREADSEIKEW